MATFQMTLRAKNGTNIVIHWPKPYLLLSTTPDEILSWVIEIWMKFHLVSDSNCNTAANLHKSYKERQIMLGYHLVLVALHHGLQLVLSKTNRIGDTTYHIYTPSPLDISK